MNLLNEIWYNVFSFLTQKSQCKFSSLWNLHNFDIEEIELMYSSNNLWYDTASKGYIKLIRLLIKFSSINVNDRDITNWTALHKTSYNGNKEIAELLIKFGADVNIKDNYNWTALHIASDRGHKEIVELLIKAGGININKQDNDGNTVLHYASNYGYKECVELLIKAGADVNIQNDKGQVALHLASRHGHKEIVTLLEKTD